MQGLLVLVREENRSTRRKPQCTRENQEQNEQIDLLYMSFQVRQARAPALYCINPTTIDFE